MRSLVPSSRTYQTPPIVVELKLSAYDHESSVVCYCSFSQSSEKSYS
ncbi:hypothetical protein PC116_g23653 [Phytophthora cactorum]|nr:hypothetical protein PC114_g18520 [Phytophthora cactorum]KAG3002925.1 hypothetical protein PC120_g19439 [Phytophthora cactorum]KAG4227979.1 hypothetical protein PC116_g23653 [Phytophthora cactorum]